MDDEGKLTNEPSFKSTRKSSLTNNPPVSQVVAQNDC